MDSDLDMKDHKLTNAVLINSVLENVVNATIFNLRVTPYSSNPYAEDSIAVYVDGYLRSTDREASLSAKGHLMVRSIGGFRLEGDISGGGHKLTHISLSGPDSSVDDVASVSTNTLRVSSLKAGTGTFSAQRLVTMLFSYC
jgi:hypothetical protein